MCHFFLNFGALFETLLNWSHQNRNVPQFRNCEQSRSVDQSIRRWAKKKRDQLGPDEPKKKTPEAWLRPTNGIFLLCSQIRNWGTFRFLCDQFKSVSNRAPKFKKKWHLFDTICRQRNTSHIRIKATNNNTIYLVMRCITSKTWCNCHTFNGESNLL